MLSLMRFVYTGTVMVRPEPVDNGRDDFRGPEFRSQKSRKDFSRRRGGQYLLLNISKNFWLDEGVVSLVAKYSN